LLFKGISIFEGTGFRKSPTRQPPHQASSS
jgi:hypothetical protein